MKLKVKPERLGAREFSEKLEIMRLWPDTYKKQIGPIVRHIAHLDDKIEKLESELRELKQAHFFESQAKANQSAHERTTVKLPKKIIPASKGERAYHLFTSKRDTLGAYLRLNRDVTKEELKFEANKWALENGKDFVH